MVFFINFVYILGIRGSSFSENRSRFLYLRWLVPGPKLFCRNIKVFLAGSSVTPKLACCEHRRFPEQAERDHQATNHLFSHGIPKLIIIPGFIFHWTWTGQITSVRLAGGRAIHSSPGHSRPSNPNFKLASSSPTMTFCLFVIRCCLILQRHMYRGFCVFN